MSADDRGFKYESIFGLHFSRLKFCWRYKSDRSGISRGKESDFKIENSLPREWRTEASQLMWSENFGAPPILIICPWIDFKYYYSCLHELEMLTMLLLFLLYEKVFLDPIIIRRTELNKFAEKCHFRLRNI